MAMGSSDLDVIRIPDVLRWDPGEDRDLLQSTICEIQITPMSGSTSTEGEARKFLLTAQVGKLILICDGGNGETILRNGDLRASLQLIERCVPGAFQFAFAHLKVLFLRQFSTRTRFSSSSWVTKPGLAAFDNACNATPLRLAEAIVHEAIHSFLYRIEENDASFQATIREPIGQIISPWTQRTLAYHSFFHAIFVWFGVLNFLELVNRHEPSREAEMRIDTIRSGFGSTFLAGKIPPQASTEFKFIVAEIERTVAAGHPSGNDESSF